MRDYYIRDITGGAYCTCEVQVKADSFEDAAREYVRQRVAPTGERCLHVRRGDIVRQVLVDAAAIHAKAPVVGREAMSAPETTDADATVVESALGTEHTPPGWMFPIRMMWWEGGDLLVMSENGDIWRCPDAVRWDWRVTPTIPGRLIGCRR